PYVSPRASLDGAGGEGRWMVMGKSLWFQDGSKLPKIDLTSGGDRNDLEATSRVFRPRMKFKWLILFLTIVAGGIVADLVTAGIEAEDEGMFRLGIVVLIVIATFALLRRFAPAARLHFQQSRFQAARQKAWLAVLGVLALIGGTLA